MRIAIVNDMMMAIEAIRRVLVNAPGHQIAWVARNGAEAVKRCTKDTPDLILMDLIMPEMDGVEATRQIMASTPCAIVAVTANVNNNSSKVFEAMGAGALDAVNTPILERTGVPSGAEALLTKIGTISRIIGGSKGKISSIVTRHSIQATHEKRTPLVAIGASAGGPAALAKVLASLPANFPAPIIIVQHVDAQFAPGLASWLDFQTALPVRIAQQGDQPRPGIVLLAGTENHLVLIGPNRLGYTVHPRETSYRPSVDVFFKSVDRLWQGDGVGVLLTGMGRDGALGLKALHDSGHHTIAQDRSTSAVYGMPKAAAELKAAREILPLDKIGPRVTNILGRKLKT
jgi:two-component system, chemotaxis family, response regulator WspF